MSRVLRVTRSHEEPGTKREVQAATEVFEDDPLAQLRSDDTFDASVSVSIDAKFSENAYFGSGTFDRAPYSLGCFCSVKLNCAQTEPVLAEARERATQLAWEGARAGLAYVHPKHVSLIHEQYPHLFGDDDQPHQE